MITTPQELSGSFGRPEKSAHDHTAEMQDEAAAIAAALRHAWLTNEHMNEAHRYVARSFAL